MKNENAIFILHSIDDYLKRKNDYSERDHDAIMMAIEALKQERPHGEWIKFTLEGGFLSTHKCSNCGFHGNQLWHFCPNCGRDNIPKIHGCSFADETCEKNPCKDCGLREGDRNEQTTD